MPWLIVIVAVFLAGAGLRLFAAGEASGRASMQQQLDAADAKLASKAQALEQETANHIDDMQTAFEVGEQNAKTRTITIRAKGAADVQTYPVFRNPACVLPADSLRTLNSARAGFRAAPDPAARADPVRDATAVDAGHAGGAVPPDAGGRRPLGKVR